MKKIILMLVVLTLFLSSCAQNNEHKNDVNIDNKPQKEYIPNFDNLSDKELIDYVEDKIYQETVANLNSDDYIVENVTAVYVSDEYLEEVAYNSQEDIYFGYNLEQLNDVFNGKKYVFTLGENGQTTVKKLEFIDDTLNKDVLKNITIGSGVILICVTVSVVSTGVGAPAISAIFLSSAKTASIYAASSGAIGAVSAGIVRGVETGNLEEATKAAALAGSEGFKWGAISGAIHGGLNKTFELKRGIKSGLTMDEVAAIQKESKYPIDFISEIHSVKEYEIYKKSTQKIVKFKGRNVLIPKIDLNYKTILPDGSEITNLERMRKGLAPINPIDNKPYQIHHVGQKNDGSLVILTDKFHKENYQFLHYKNQLSEIDRESFAKLRKEIYQMLSELT